MEIGLGVGPNTPNMPPAINTGKIVTPVNIVKFAIILSVVLVACYGFFIDTNALLISCLIIQFLFVALLAVMAVQGIKAGTKQKRIISYTYLVVALFSLILGIISYLEISRFW
jgi:hypothetical protein